MSVVSVHAAITTGHAGFPPTVSTGGSGLVFISSQPVIETGTTFAPHTDPNGNVHTPKQSEGSSFVFTEGNAVARIGDGLDCGDALASGNSFVFIEA